MELSARGTVAAVAMAVVLAGPGCVDIVGADFARAKYVERE